MKKRDVGSCKLCGKKIILWQIDWANLGENLMRIQLFSHCVLKHPKKIKYFMKLIETLTGTILEIIFNSVAGIVMIAAIIILAPFAALKNLIEEIRFRN